MSERWGDRGEVEVQARIYGCNNGISAAGPLTRRHFPSSSSHYRMDGSRREVCVCVRVHLRALMFLSAHSSVVEDPFQRSVRFGKSNQASFQILSLQSYRSLFCLFVCLFFWVFFFLWLFRNSQQGHAHTLDKMGELQP